MSVRKTTRKLTGVPTRKFEVSLGTRNTGNPGVTVRHDYGAYFCLDDPKVVLQLLTDLAYAYGHLTGEDVTLPD